MIIYDSEEEGHFAEYLQELVSIGFIQSWHYHPKPFLLCEKATYQYNEQLKTKTNIKNGFLLNQHSYQADFLVYWYEKAHILFYGILNNGDQAMKYPFVANNNGRIWSVIDTKGSFIGPHNNSAISFPLDQKWVYQKYGIYVQKVIPKKLFESTFTPLAYTKTPTGKDRKINFKVKTLTDYINNHTD